MSDLHGIERKQSPRLLPKLNNEVDFASLDYQDVDVFLSSFSSSDKAQVTKHMTKQLKSLRSLLSLSSQLASGVVSDSSFVAIIKATANIISAEKLFVLDIDHQHGQLVVRHSVDNSCIGVKTSIMSGVEASVIAQKRGVVLNDFTSSPTANVDFYHELHVASKNVMVVPIVLIDTVVGLVLAFNKQTDDFNFTKFDLTCLETIAANMAIVHQLSVYAKVRSTPSVIADSPTSVASSLQVRAEAEAILADVVEDAYRLIGADRVSIFVDNGNHDLLCVASQDILGAIFPLSGFAGLCFTSRKPCNIPNVKNDKRHCTDIDERIKYETTSLLCVPLIGSDGEALGVIQALNKKFGEPFSSANEQALQQLATRAANALCRLKSVSQQLFDPSNSIVQSLGDFSSEACASTLRNPRELLSIVQKYGKSIVNCDHLYVYTTAPESTPNKLVLEQTLFTGGDSKRYHGDDIHAKVREAMSSKKPTEIVWNRSEESLFPGVLANNAFIVPLQSFESPKRSEDILVVSRKPSDFAPITISAPEEPEKHVDLTHAFKNTARCNGHAAFSAIEKQGLISLATMFGSALHLYATLHPDEFNDSNSNKSLCNGTVSKTIFDSKAVYSGLSEGDKSELENLFDWHFNVLNIRSKEALHYAVVALFDKEFSFGEMHMDREKVMAYILEVDRNYFDNPFHNFYHAVCVTHFDFMLLSVSHAEKHLSPIMRFASLLSALVHDVAHPGNTNMFEINMRSNLAILYNDTSVLENHHCSTAFRLMNKKGLGIFDEIEFGERAEIRKMMIACIIATDMHYHVSLIELIANRASQDEWIIDNFTERMNYGKILLHAADLSNPTRRFVTSRAWAERVSEEFNQQGKNEKAAGIPVSTFLLSHDLKSFVKNELFFSGHIVFPMWKELVRLYPNMSHITDQIAINLDSWKELIK